MEYAHIGKETGTESVAKGSTSWSQFNAMLFLQIGGTACARSKGD